MILALDTTAEFGSIALLKQGRVLEEVLLHSPDGFGHVLFGQIERLLGRHDASLSEVDCFAAASGPGSFTGVRIGLAAVKGFAAATEKCAIAVSNLQALACYGSADLRATVIDARRGEIYGGLYDRELKLRSPEVVIKFQDWIKTLPSSGVELISTNAAPFGPFLEGMPAVTAPRALAAAVGQIAWARFETGDVDDLARVDANYVRRSDAELFWKE